MKCPQPFFSVIEIVNCTIISILGVMLAMLEIVVMVAMVAKFVYWPLPPFLLGWCHL